MKILILDQGRELSERPELAVLEGLLTTARNKMKNKIHQSDLQELTVYIQDFLEQYREWSLMRNEVVGWLSRDTYHDPNYRFKVAVLPHWQALYDFLSQLNQVAGSRKAMRRWLQGLKEKAFVASNKKPRNARAELSATVRYFSFWMLLLPYEADLDEGLWLPISRVAQLAESVQPGIMRDYIKP